jgi:polyisoprenoid-binding protein YceI
MRRIVVAALIAATALTGAHAVAQQQPAAATTQAAAPAPRSGSYQLDKSHAKIVWAANHFGFSTYYGEFTDFDAKLTLDAAAPERSSLNVTVAIPSVSTNNPALEKHLSSADFFDAANHATATFVSTAVRRTGATTADVTGDFTLRGVTKPLTLQVTLNGAAESPVSKKYTVGFSAEGTIKRSEYGMTYAVPGVADDVKLLISGEFNPAA